MYKTILLFLALLLFVLPVSAQQIISYENDVSNNAFLRPYVSEDQSITFSVSTVDVDTHHWYKNGVDQGHDFNTYTTSWDNWGDVAEVTYIGTAGGASTNNLTWEPVIIRARATTPARHLDMTRSDEFVNATDDMDIELMLAAELYMYTDSMGFAFYLFIIGIPMVMIYVRTGSLIIPGVIGIVSGAFVVNLLPAAYQMPVLMLIVLSVVAVLLGIFKERGSK